MSLENDLPLCHSVSQGPRDPCAKDECSHRNTCTRYRDTVRPVKCSDCSIWDSCPALALRNKRTGCSFFKPFAWVDYIGACEANILPESQKLLNSLQALFAEKDHRIAELTGQLEGAEHERDDLQRQLDEASSVLASIERELINRPTPEEKSDG